MMVAARTAPKGRGRDNLYLGLAEGQLIREIADKMKEIAEKTGVEFFIRDANNILTCPVVVLMGTRIESRGLKRCGMCGFGNCETKDQHPDVPCVFNTGDLGIAIGSAVSLATDRRVDNRIMYTVGQAVLEMMLFPPEVKIVYGIPLSATSKNPFFDRK